jgi:hypothetical protein
MRPFERDLNLSGNDDMAGRKMQRGNIGDPIGNMH